jgi:hypothetical protein
MGQGLYCAAMAATKNEANEEIDALVAAGDAAKLTELAASSDKERAKAARRGLHLLRTRGVSVPAPKKAAAAPPRAIGDSAEAWTCVPDANGERLVVAVVPSPGGDFNVITAHVSDERGLLQLAFGKGPRKHARDVRKSFEESGGFAGDVPIERATLLVEAAYQLTLQRGASPPAEFAAARRVLPPVRVAPDAPHPALAEIPPAEAFDRDAAELLHQLPTIARWIVPGDELRALEQRLEEVATSRLLVDERQRQTAWQDAIDGTITRAFDAAGRARWQRRLYDAAIVFAAAGHGEDAAALRAQGDRLADAAFDPLTDPFARGMVEKVTRGLRMPPLPGDEHDDAPDVPPAGGGLIVPP